MTEWTALALGALAWASEGPTASFMVNGVRASFMPTRIIGIIVCLRAAWSLL